VINLLKGEPVSVLDLQGMETPAPQTGAGGHSSGSNGHSCPSDVSLLICDHNSGVSLTLC
jgi:lanthionine-containing peptide SapB